MMTPVKLNAVLMLTILLLSWNALDRKAQAGNGYSCFGPVTMLQEQLDLSDEQVAAMQEIFTDHHRAMLATAADQGLEQGNLQGMRREMATFRQQGLIELAAILGQEQLQLLRTEILESSPLQFRQLSEEEKLVRVQNGLGISEEEARQVAAILEQSMGQRGKVLQDAGVNLEQMMAIRRQMSEQRLELIEELSTVLDEEQQQRFAEFSSRMQQKNSGYGFPMMDMDGRL